MLCTHRTHTHISANLEYWKHPSQRDVPPYWSRSFAFSSLTRGTCGYCACPRTPQRCSCELSPCIVPSSVLLNVLKISWDSCESFGVNSTDPNLQCAYLEVPMDYHDSTAGTARLAVAKYAATAPKKLGTVFFNPGNPLHSSFLVPTNIPFLQVDPAVQESRASLYSVRSSARLLKAPTTLFPGILGE